MEAKYFPQVNIEIAKDQPQYQTLPAHCDLRRGTMTACFELSAEERKQVLETGKIFLTIHTANKPLQPIDMSLLSPFEE